MVPIKRIFFLVNPKTSLSYIFISELSEGKKKKLQRDPLFFWPRSLLGLCSEQAVKIHFLLGQVQTETLRPTAPGWFPQLFLTCKFILLKLEMRVEIHLTPHSVTGLSQKREPERNIGFGASKRYSLVCPRTGL